MALGDPAFGPSYERLKKQVAALQDERDALYRKMAEADLDAERKRQADVAQALEVANGIAGRLARERALARGIATDLRSALRALGVAPMRFPWEPDEEE